MLEKYRTVAVIAICVIIAFLFSEVDSQSTVDDSASCESSTLNEVVNLIREDLKDVKTRLGSNQQQSNASCISNKDLEDLKAVCTSNQQHCAPTECSSPKQVIASSFLGDYTELLVILF